jgi:hypothetical protein
MQTNNETWGFYGIIRHHADPAQAWPLAMRAIGEATGCTDEAVRDFRDSRHGRHFADDVTNGVFDGLEMEAAIDAAIDRWMGWTTDGYMESELGIPRGLPYLTGLVNITRSWLRSRARLDERCEGVATDRGSSPAIGWFTDRPPRPCTVALLRRCL